MTKYKEVIKDTLRLLEVVFGVSLFTVAYFVAIPAFIFGKFPITLNSRNVNIIESILVILLVLILFGVKLVAAKHKEGIKGRKENV